MPEHMDYLFKFHSRGGHEVVYFIVNQEVGATSYYQYVNTDGHWYMMKAAKTAAVTVYTYSAPVKTSTTSLAAGWAGRAALTYKTPDEAFV